MKRPPSIYELLGKVSDGTFLNEKEFRELEHYINDLEEHVPDCKMCKHTAFEHHYVEHADGMYLECFVKDCECFAPRGY